MRDMGRPSTRSQHALYQLFLFRPVTPTAEHAVKMVDSLNGLLTALARQGISITIDVNNVDHGGVMHQALVLNMTRGGAMVAHRSEQPKMPVQIRALATNTSTPGVVDDFRPSQGTGAGTLARHRVELGISE